MVYVLSKEGKPLTPTTRHGKVRRMLNEGKAKVVQRSPFTIQLLYTPKTDVRDNMVMGIDLHKNKIGVSIIDVYNGKEILAAEVIPRQDVHKVAQQTRQLRQSRRRRNKKRKRKPNKFRHTKYKYMFGNSIESVFMFETVNFIRRMRKILPIKFLRIESREISPKDHFKPMEKLFKHSKNDDFEKRKQIKLNSYRSKILARDHHLCQHCYGKSKDPILVIRRINKYDVVNGIIQNVYVTLCKHCAGKLDHLNNTLTDRNHQIKYVDMIKRIGKNQEKFEKENPIKYGKTRPNLFKLIKSSYKNLCIEKEDIRHTYGYYTKYLRRKLGISYSPINNARIISTIPYDKIQKSDNYYIIRYRKHHDRSLHKITPKKGGVRPPRSPKVVHGFQSYDLVKCYHKKHPELWGKTFYITKKRKTGYFGIGKADGTTILQSVKYDCLKLVKRTGNYSIQVV